MYLPRYVFASLYPRAMCMLWRSVAALQDSPFIMFTNHSFPSLRAAEGGAAIQGAYLCCCTVYEKCVSKMKKSGSLRRTHGSRRRTIEVCFSRQCIVLAPSFFAYFAVKSFPFPVFASRRRRRGNPGHLSQLLCSI